jgi:hypothetical protein
VDWGLSRAGRDKRLQVHIVGMLAIVAHQWYTNGIPNGVLNGIPIVYQMIYHMVYQIVYQKITSTQVLGL